MAKQLDQKEVTTVEELIMANMYQLDAITQLLIEKLALQAKLTL
jgi:hypothetical protein